MYRSQGQSGSLDLLLPSQPHFGSEYSQHSQASWPRPPLDTLTPSSYGSASDTERDSRLSRHSRPYTLHSVPSFSHSSVKEGLRTPPSEDMTTSYHSPLYNPSPLSRYYGPSEGEYHHVRSSANATSPTYANGQIIRTATDSHAAPRASSPVMTSTSSKVVVGGPGDGGPQRKSEILPNLQIPSSINPNGGSIGEFAAKITCLFWFESTATLYHAEQCDPKNPLVEGRLAHDAVPTSAFKKWVVTILTITQVTPQVICLALLFVYRLKTLNPTVKGRAGSEYRLLTVALMLGNKFLDDNTYTNKTWAEVSGISVQEIHVMEVEFLSNMRYSLLASAEQWADWHKKLTRFEAYFNAASSIPAPVVSPIAVQAPILPSPISNQASPPSQAAYGQHPPPFSFVGQQWPGQYTTGISSHLPSMPELVPTLEIGSRKRSYDEGAEEPAPKRLHSEALPMPLSTHTSRQGGPPRLPVPNLSISTTQAMSGGHPAHSQVLPLLPPLAASGRAMSAVYPTTPSYAPHTHGAITPTAQLNQMQSGSQYGTPSRRHSPLSTANMMSMNSSPIAGAFHHSQNSPSIYLQQRSSPYKPVRLPHTLLHPPPSGALQGYSGSHDQMHYHPLGRRTDYRSGVVPEYVSHPAYHQQWPILPQPNFYN